MKNEKDFYKLFVTTKICIISVVGITTLALFVLAILY